MRDYVIINGVNSLTIDGLAISKLPPITKPLIRSQIEQIDGRDGDLITELGYAAYDKTLEIGLYGEFDIDEIIKYFTGEGTIVFSNESDKYYNFKILNQIDYEKLLKFKTASVVLHCQPFKYPVEETPIQGETINVSGSGSNITLDNTVVAQMNVDLKGNTTQQTYTGTNILQTDGATTTKSNVTCTNNGDGVFTINGTASANASFPLTVSSVGMEMGSGQAYTLVMDIISNGGTTGSALTGAIQKSGTTQYNFFSIVPANSTGLKVQVSTPSEAATLKEINYYVGSGVQINNLKIRVYMVKGSYTTSTVPTYEPYVGGIPSPNTSYPQDIHTVKGDNTINVCGKNLVCGKIAGYYVNASGGFSSGAYDMQIAKVIRGNTYIVSTDQSGLVAGFFTEYPTTSSTTYNSSRIVENNKVFTAPITGYIAFRTGNDYEYAQLEKGSTATSYQPYESKNYVISLGEQNLINNVMTSQTLNGVQFSVNEDKSIWISGTATARTEPKLWTNASGTLILKANTTYYNNSNMTLYIYHGQYTIIDVGGHYTPTEDKTVQQIYIRVENGETINKTLYPMLSTKENASYYPYGKYIEMCKIGDYADTFIKTDGKNMFNEWISGTVNTSTGEITSVARNRSDYIEVQPSTSYSIWREDTGFATYMIEYNSSKTFIQEQHISSAGTSGTFTTNANTKYVILYQYTGYSPTNKLMFNLGDTALPYEPYGSGEWYKKALIGKVDLSSLSWTTTYNIGGGFRLCGTTSIGNIKYASVNTEIVPAYAEKYIERQGSEMSSAAAKYHCAIDTNKFVVHLETDINPTGLFYYPLSFPDFTKITDETLISQLETKMLSYNPQTNITQTNDDAPFNLDVSLSYTDTMNVNNVGNIYAKPILELEGSGNIEVVLNDIQILEINLGDGGKIAIDVPNLQAYNPDDNTLLNRLVTGDYMKLLIQEGDNTIAFSGSVTSATLTKYTRYI